MFCKECGANIPNDSKFCSKCGIPISEEIRKNIASYEDESGSGGSESNTTVDPNKEINKQDKRTAPEKTEAAKEAGAEKEPLKKGSSSIAINKKFVTIAAIVIVASIIAAIFIGALRSRPVKVDLNKYITISCNGYDGYGTANYEFDYNSFREDYADKLKVDLDRVSAYKDELFYAEMKNMPATDTLMQYLVKGSIDNRSGLANGDIVRYVWNCDDEEAKEMYGCTLVYSDIEITVSDLKPVEKYDAFQTVTIQFSGLDGDGKAALEKTGDNISASIDKTDGLSNGDTVTVSIDIGDIEQYINVHGRVPEELEKEYVVSGLGKTKLEAADISDDFIQSIYADSKSTVESEVLFYCRAKNKYLMDWDSIPLTWSIEGEVTSAPDLFQIDVGNGRDSSHNMLLLLYEVPYKAFVSSSMSGNNDGQVVADGSAYMVLEYDDAIVYDDTDHYLGKYKNKGIYSSKDDLKQVQESFKNKYEFFSVDTKGYTSTTADNDAESTIETTDKNDIDQKLIEYVKKQSESKDSEYLLIDLNDDGTNELLLRTDGYRIPSVYQYKDNKIVTTDWKKDSAVYTYINTNKQYIADESNEIDAYQYEILEVDSEGRVSVVLYLSEFYDEDSDSWECYKLENPPETITIDKCEKISENEFNKLKEKYINEDQSLVWERISP